MSKIVSNYPRRTGEPTVEEAAALKAAFSGLYLLLYWLPIGVSAWWAIVDILLQLVPNMGPVEMGRIPLAALVLMVGNLMMYKAIRNSSIGLGYGEAGLPRLHLLLYLGNLLFLGIGGFVVLHLKLHNVLRSSRMGFMSRRELVNSWSEDVRESKLKESVGRQEKAVTLDAQR